MLTSRSPLRSGLNDDEDKHDLIGGHLDSEEGAAALDKFLNQACEAAAQMIDFAAKCAPVNQIFIFVVGEDHKCRASGAGNYRMSETWSAICIWA